MSHPLILPLTIPWFRPTALEIPHEVAWGIAAVVALGAIRKDWRSNALTMAGVIVAISAVFKFVVETDSIAIQPFGVLVMTGVLVAERMGEWEAKRRGIDPHVFADFVTHVVFFGFIGSPLFNLLAYQQDTLMEMITTGELKWPGLSSYGGFLGAIVGMMYWQWKTKIPVRPIVDIVVWGFPLGWFFGRMGCFTVHDHPGLETDFFLGVGPWDGIPGGPIRHDLGLYEMLLSALFMTVTWFMKDNKKLPQGFFAAAVPMAYAPVRFFLDTLRLPPEQHGGDIRYFGMTPAQYASIAFFLFSAALLYRFYKLPPVTIPPHAQWPRSTPGDDASAEEAQTDAPKSKSSTKRRKKKA